MSIAKRLMVLGAGVALVAGALVLGMKGFEPPGPGVAASSVGRGEQDSAGSIHEQVAPERTLPPGGGAQSADGPGIQESQPWQLEVKVTNRTGEAIAGAHITVDYNWQDKRDESATTDGSGVAVFSFGEPPAGVPKGKYLFTVWVAAPHHTDALKHLTPGEFASPGRRGDCLFVLGDGGDLTVRVVDQNLAPVPGAVVIFHLCSELTQASGRAIGQEVLGSYRRLTGGDGILESRGHFPGVWCVQAVSWRDCLSGECQDIEILPSSNPAIELSVERLDPAEYASGKLLLDDGSPWGPARSERIYLRKMEAPRRTCGVYEDGVFFLTLESDEPETWEAAEVGGWAVSDPFLVANGMQDLEVYLEL